jgi:deoxyribonuclease V
VKINALHEWNLEPTAAVELQRQLAGKVDSRAPLLRCDFVAGVDASYNRFSTTFYASVVVLRASDCSIVEVRNAVREVAFPYVPGLLSFREAPVLLDALAQVETEPDVILFDGQGIAHPRRFGIAAHVGLWLDRPCVGCAKSLLCGKHREPARRAGAVAALRDRGEVIGHAVRSKTGVKPLYVSVGHKIDLPSAVKVVLQTCRGYRLPEPTRQAHLHVNALRRANAEPA